LDGKSFPVPEEMIAACAATALTLCYSAPMPGVGSRYVDGPVAHESRLLTVGPVGEALAAAGRRGVGETVLDATLASLRLAGHADLRSTGYLVPLARAALLAETPAGVLSGLGNEDIPPFARALGAVVEDGSPGAVSWSALSEALRVALTAGREATLRDAMRFASARDPLAREYARGYEVTLQLARPALLSAFGRAESARAALVQSYLEVLSEVPDLDVAARAGREEAEEVARMARGVIKAGGVHSRRGLQAVANLDGLLRADARRAPSATEPPVTAAAFLVALDHGPGALSQRLRPATGGNRGR
jgi:triphosphoribosyl-dephospho-CoA synthase